MGKARSVREEDLEQIRLPSFVVIVGRGSKGKSFLGSHLIDRARSAGREVIIADGDRGNPSLKKNFGSVTSPSSADSRTVKAWVKDVTELAITTRTSAVLDLGGGDLVFRELAAQINFQELLETNGIRPVACHLLGPDPADWTYVRALEAGPLFAPPATMIVLNHALTPAHLTPAMAFQGVLVGNRTLDAIIERGGRFLEMPHLEPAPLIAELGLSLIEAAQGLAPEGQNPLGPWDRQTVEFWLKQMEAALLPVEAWLP